jgi:hypothetical protein
VEVWQAILFGSLIVGVPIVAILVVVSRISTKLERSSLSWSVSSGPPESLNAACRIGWAGDRYRCAANRTANYPLQGC